MDDRPRAPRSTLVLLSLGLVIEVTGFQLDNQQLALGLQLIGGAVIVAAGGAIVAAWTTRRELKVAAALPPLAPAPLEPKVVEKIVVVESLRDWLSEPPGDLQDRLNAPEVTSVQRDALMEQVAAIGKWVYAEIGVQNVNRDNRGIIVYGYLIRAGANSHQPLVGFTFTPDADTERVAALNRGDTLVAVGRIAGWTLGFSLENCELVRSYRPLMAADRDRTK